MRALVFVKFSHLTPSPVFIANIAKLAERGNFNGKKTVDFLPSRRFCGLLNV